MNVKKPVLSFLMGLIFIPLTAQTIGQNIYVAYSKAKKKYSLVEMKDWTPENNIGGTYKVLVVLKGKRLEVWFANTDDLEINSGMWLFYVKRDYDIMKAVIDADEDTIKFSDDTWVNVKSDLEFSDEGYDVNAQAWVIVIQPFFGKNKSNSTTVKRFSY